MKQNKQPRWIWDLILLGKDSLGPRSHWPFQVWCLCSCLPKHRRLSSYLMIGPLLQPSWPGLTISNKRTEYLVFIAASRVHWAVRMFGFYCHSTFRAWSVPSVLSPVTPLCIPKLPLDQLQFPAQALSMFCLWFPANSFQGFKQHSFPEASPKPPSLQHSDHFPHSLHFQCWFALPWHSSWKENVHPLGFQFPESGAYTIAPQNWCQWGTDPVVNIGT